MSSGADERVARLYGLPLAEFTPERNALAAELRAEGDRDAAASVKALRKPTAAAWAINQLVRAEPDLVEALLGAGGELRQAHRQAASGKGAEQLRAAAEAERSAVEQLLARAREVLGEVPGPALVDAIRNTLHAASSDDEARERIASGTLVTAMRPVGLGPVPGGGVVAPRAEREATSAHAREIKAASAAEAALAREVEAAERSLARAEEALTRAREAADAAAARAADARKRLRSAKSELTAARKRRASLERY